MTEWFLSVLAFALCWAGMQALGLAMDRHYEQLTGRRAPPPSQRVALRAAGGVLLAAALWVCFSGWGPAIGFVVWWGFLTLGALAVALLLPALPRAGVGAAAVAGVLAALVWLAT